MQGAGVAVDVHSVGPHADGPDPGPELREDQGRDAVGRPVGGVHDHPEPVEGEVPVPVQTPGGERYTMQRIDLDDFKFLPGRALQRLT